MRLALSKHIFIRMEGELHFHGIIFVMKTFFSCNLFVFKHGAKSLNKRINKNYVREFFFSLFCRCKQPFKTRRNKQGTQYSQPQISAQRKRYWIHKFLCLPRLEFMECSFDFTLARPCPIPGVEALIAKSF